jgi:5-methyltetrahydrofolate--homocysteine methyltransferase
MNDPLNLKKTLLEGNAKELTRLIDQALKEGWSAERILKEGLISGMDVVGEKFKAGDLFVPEVLIIARAMQSAMEVLKPKLAETASDAAGTVVIGTVKGDLHDIGKNLVAMMIEGAGFEVVDLGIDTPPERFVETAEQREAQIVAMSALLTTTLPFMGKTIEGLEQAGLRRRVKIMIGGAPVTRKYADEIGADSYCPDAIAAVDAARSYAGLKP